MLSFRMMVPVVAVLGVLSVVDVLGSGLFRHAVFSAGVCALGALCVVSIADTACGIPKDVAGRIFDPFFTTKEVGRGTGQGLAIARTLVVDRHGGTLTFDTEVGRGTTSHVRLPIGHDEVSGAIAA
jgi:signal transduction histidine kinase